MVPFTRAAVPEVAPGQGFVRIDSLAAGLVEEEEPHENTGARSGNRTKRR